MRRALMHMVKDPVDRRVPYGALLHAWRTRGARVAYAWRTHGRLLNHQVVISEVEPALHSVKMNVMI